MYNRSAKVSGKSVNRLSISSVRSLNSLPVEKYPLAPSCRSQTEANRMTKNRKNQDVVTPKSKFTPQLDLYEAVEFWKRRSEIKFLMNWRNFVKRTDDVIQKISNMLLLLEVVPQFTGSGCTLFFLAVNWLLNWFAWYGIITELLLYLPFCSE